jgi:hypothetical protein
MLPEGFDVAHVSPPSGGSSGPGWLVGIHTGARVFIIGAAPGVDDPARLSALRGQVVLGTNWTLELMPHPTYLQIVDAMVWRRQQGRVQDTQAIVLASKGIFGRSGYYSWKSPNIARIVGRPGKPHIEMFNILAPQRGRTDPKTRIYHPTLPAPYLATAPDHPFFLGGNSACYAINWAHLMGAKDCVLYGFTMKSNGGYFFGNGEKPTPQSGIYDTRYLKPFMEFVAQHEPGFVKLAKGWEGPLYDWKIFEEIEILTSEVPRVSITGRPSVPWR